MESKVKFMDHSKNFSLNSLGPYKHFSINSILIIYFLIGYNTTSFHIDTYTDLKLKDQLAYTFYETVKFLTSS